MSQPRAAAAQKANVILGRVNGDLESRSREALALVYFTAEDAYRGCVSGIRVVVQDAREAEVRDFANQVAVDEDVTSRQVPVDVTQIGEVAHAGADAPEHDHQLEHRKLPVVFLERRGGK